PFRSSSSAAPAVPFRAGAGSARPPLQATTSLEPGKGGAPSGGDGVLGALSIAPLGVSFGDSARCAEGRREGGDSERSESVRPVRSPPAFLAPSLWSIRR